MGTLRLGPIGRRRLAALGLALLAGCAAEPRYSLVVVSASLSAVDPSGHGCSTWDCGSGTDPDPYFTVESPSDDFSLARTPPLTDTLTPVWNHVVVTGLTASELAHPMWFRVFDRDDLLFKGNDDLMARFDVTLAPEQIAPGTVTVTTGAGERTYSLTIEIR